MGHQTNAVNRRALTEHLLSQPEILEDILLAVTEGRTLVQWCHAHDAVYSQVLGWLVGDSERSKAYTNALEVRRQNSVDRVLGELHRLAGADISLVFNEDGSPKPLHEIPEDVRRCISAVEVEELFEGRGEARAQVGLVHKFKLWDKGAALERLGRHLKLFTDKLEVDASPELADALAKARQRLKDQEHA